MAFLEELVQYAWNWSIYLYAYTSLQYVWFVGIFGVFWDDDDGYMTNELYKVIGGVNVKFPVQYRSDYVDPSDYAEMDKKAEEEAAEREKGN